MATAERWHDVGQFEGRYQVSNLGLVRSRERYSIDCRGRQRRVPAKILKQGTSVNGYKTVCLCRGSNEPKSWLRVHRLVAEAWVTGKSALHRVVHHLDGDKTNNSAANLRWVSSRANNLEAAKTSRRLRGEQKATSKLTDGDILPICERWDAGETIAELARDHGVAEHTIRTVLLCLTWSHIPREPRPLGTRYRAEYAAPAAKLTPRDVRTIRCRYSAGESCRQISEDYPVDRSSVCAIISGRTWSHVK